MTNRNIINKNQFTEKLKEVLPDEVYSNLDKFAQRGDIILLTLSSFYLEMNFIGLTNHDSIINEITAMVIILSSFLAGIGDEVTRICLENIKEDNRAIPLLIYYLFPFIFSLIKLKIEKGIYKKNIEVSNINVITVLNKLERKIEIDESGNLKVTFRYQRQINSSTLNQLLK